MSRMIARIGTRLICGYLVAGCVALAVNQFYWATDVGPREVTWSDTVELTLAFVSIAYVAGAAMLILLHLVSKAEHGTVVWLLFGALSPVTLFMAADLGDQASAFGAAVSTLPFELFLVLPGVMAATIAFVVIRLVARRPETSGTAPAA